MALGLDLSTLADLGRTASYGVQQHAQAREENSERELAKDLMRASVTADYGEITNKLNQGYYRNARPELLSRAGQSISQGLQLQRKEKRQKAIDIYQMTKDIYNDRGGRITMKEAGRLANEEYKAMVTPGYTPTPPTGNTLIEQKFGALSDFRGEELETKKEELAKDIREAHENKDITPDDYEKYMRQLQRQGQGVMFGLGQVGADIFGDISGVMRKYPGLPPTLAIPAYIRDKTIRPFIEGLTTPQIQAPPR